LLGSTEREVSEWDDQEFEASQLNLLQHLDAYDLEHRERVLVFRASLANDVKESIEENKASQIAKDGEALLRKSRNENLWKQLLRYKQRKTAGLLGRSDEDSDNDDTRPGTISAHRSSTDGANRSTRLLQISPGKLKRIPVHKRWYYEPVVPLTTMCHAPSEEQETSMDEGRIERRE
jgi:hypothetical protein